MDTNDTRITLPASKSMSNRWLILNHLLGGKLHVSHLSSSNDTRLLRTLLQQLEKGIDHHFYCDNAGSVARFLMPLLAITNGEHILDGNQRLRQRPMGPLIDALLQMGLRIECLEEKGFLPVRIKGSIPTHRTISIDPTLSSQFVSALLMIAPRLENGMSITMTGRPTSRPYIEMTCDALRQIGVDVRRSSNGRSYYVQPFPTHTKNISVTIERDWSSASYFYTMALMRPNLKMRLIGLQLQSCQGDSAAHEFFSQLGIESTEVRTPYRTSSRSITLRNTGEYKKQVQFNCIDCPDLVPTFAVAAAIAGVKATLKGVSNIALKESDRMLAITEELLSLGIHTEHNDNILTILPSTIVPTRPIHTYNDHRIAMASPLW